MAYKWWLVTILTNWDDPPSSSYRGTRKIPKVGLSVKIITLERWGHFIVSIHYLSYAQLFTGFFVCDVHVFRYKLSKTYMNLLVIGVSSTSFWRTKKNIFQTLSGQNHHHLSPIWKININMSKIILKITPPCWYNSSFGQYLKWLANKSRKKMVSHKES